MLCGARMPPGWPDWLEAKGQAMLLVFPLVGFPLLQSALCPGGGTQNKAAAWSISWTEAKAQDRIRSGGPWVEWTVRGSASGLQSRDCPGQVWPLNSGWAPGAELGVGLLPCGGGELARPETPSATEARLCAPHTILTKAGHFLPSSGGPGLGRVEGEA